jgi:rubrerythrin
MEAVLVEHKKSSFSAFPRKKFSVMHSSEILEKPIKQYLYFAFRRSIRDAETYENAASGIPDDERHSFLIKMAQRKREEADRLYSYYTTNGYRTINDMKKRSIIAHPHYLASRDLVQISSIEDTYSFAFKREHDTLNLYSKLARLDSNPYTKILFDYLAQLQMGNIVFIEKQLTLGSLNVDLREFPVERRQ